MNLALDIDGTITRNPEFFSILSKAVRRSGGKVCIVTSRGTGSEARAATREEIASYGIEYDDLIVIPDSGTGEQIPCPHQELDWYQKYLWQKVSVCVDRGVEVVFEDDEKVIELFEKYAPGVQVYQVKTKGRAD